MGRRLQFCGDGGGRNRVPDREEKDPVDLRTIPCATCRSDCTGSGRFRGMALAGQLAQEFLLVHAVLESFPAIDEDDRHFVVELAAEFMVGIDVNFLPGKSAAAGELGETLFYNFAEVT